MSLANSSKNTTANNRNDLAAYLESGCKPESNWKLGTEHEKFGYTLDDLRPLPYEGQRGIRTILAGLAEDFDWRTVMEDGLPIALLDETGASITLEPGGQLELSGALLDSIHQTCTEVNLHLKQVRSISEPLNIAFLGMGFQPKWPLQDMQWMPKGRYRIMREYMSKVGTLGQDMMARTCTVQVNLDFGTEADMVKKFRASLALQPIATALFANSPFTDGKPNGYLSYRSHVWEDTDPDRTGMLPFVFDGDMGFEKYTDYMLDVPMYFVYRDGKYIDATGQSFRDFLDGKLPALPGERPTLKDWEDHLTTAFPEVRLKRYLEMRGADGGPWARLCALPAIWAGLLYHQPSLDAAWDIARDWSMEERLKLREEVPRLGLRATVRGRTVQSLALELIELASAGLKARARLNAAGDNETGFLGPLQQVAESGITPAERKLNLYHGEWGGSVDPVFTTCSY
ncbi:MAG: glutamate--cysteine ligase [Xanthomonadales bacterium]|nr:glutamate--cysteine ligase [Gammaproteobacteria bacterium]NND57988.1 glutamate--cysteine ligase [Xanthomonadales bacterium]NNK50846.1 glutamate--cysteine ligase [Xanthomonadales bacterium]